METKQLFLTSFRIKNKCKHSFKVLTYLVVLIIVNIKMSVENSKPCSKLTYPIKKYDHTNIKFDSSLSPWITETHEIFVKPKVEDQKIGKRRELLMKYFRIKAAEDVLWDIIGDPPLPEQACLTEYFTHFCDENFIPYMDKSECCDIEQCAKNPLYGGDIQTYYQEQFNKGNLRATPEYRNKKRPFVRRSHFTTPSEYSLENQFAKTT